MPEQTITTNLEFVASDKASANLDKIQKNVKKISEEYSGLLRTGRELERAGYGIAKLGDYLGNEQIKKVGELTAGIGGLAISLGEVQKILKLIQAGGGIGTALGLGLSIGGGIMAGGSIYDKMIQQGGALGGQNRADAGTIIKQMLSSAGASLAAGITGATLEGTAHEAEVYRKTLDDTAHLYGIISDETYLASRAQYDAAAKAKVENQAFAASIDHTAISAGEAAAALSVMGGILKGIGLTGAGGAVSRGLEVSPQFKDAAKQYADYQKQLSDLEKRTNQERLKVVTDTQNQLDVLNKKFSGENVKAYQNFVDANVKAASQLRDAQMKIVQSGNQEEQKAEQQYYQQRAKQAEAFGIEMVRIEQDHQTEIQRMNQDHTLRVRKLAETRDALAIEDENQSYELSRQRSEQDYQKEVARKNEDFARTLADNEQQFAEQRAQRQQDRTQQLAELKAQYDEQAKQRADDYNQNKKDRAQQYQEEHDKIARDGIDRLNQLNQQLTDERQSATNQWTQWRMDHQVFLTGEKALWDDYLKYTYDQLNKYLSGGTVSTGIPTGAAGHQMGGYQNYTGLARMHAGEYVLNANTTSTLERLIGGRLSQNNILGSMGGGVTLNYSPNFSGAQSDPETYRRITYEVVTDLFGRARQ